MSADYILTLRVPLRQFVTKSGQKYDRVNDFARIVQTQTMNYEF